MITKAIVEKKIDALNYKVRVPIYNKSASSVYATPTDELGNAIICAPNGCIPNYQVGDVVYVGFEDDLINQPVIIGNLITSPRPQTLTDLYGDSLNVGVNCKLPVDTIIGTTSADDIKNLSGTSGNLQGQINTLNDKVKSSVLKRSVTPNTNVALTLEPNTVAVTKSAKLTLTLQPPLQAYNSVYKVYWKPLDTPTYATPVMPTGYTLKLDGSLPTWAANKIYELTFTNLIDNTIGLTVKTWG